VRPLRLLRAGVVGGAGATLALLLFSLVTRSAPLPSRGGSGYPGRTLPEPQIPRSAQIDELRARGLVFPVPFVSDARRHDSFEDARDGGRRIHHALDIPAPRQSAVVAVDDGRLERMDKGAAGGIAVYQRDPSGRYCYYYAHLDGYADELEVGQPLRKGQVLGYVGTTGNAPANVPHLHFAVWEVAPGTLCTGTTPVDPYALFARPLPPLTAGGR
jgi:peptidoglycan LD-endopeptidase LytH